MLHDYYFSTPQRKLLLQEVHRVATPDAVVPVLPTHMEAAGFVKLMQSLGFVYKEAISCTVIHYHRVEQNEVLIFGKNA